MKPKLRNGKPGPLVLLLLLLALCAPAGAFEGSTYQSGLKDGFGTARDTGSRVWFTLTRGAVSEVYAPTIASPILRGISFAVVGRAESGGPPYVDFEQEDMTHRVTLIDTRALGYQVTSSHAEHGYTLTKRIFTDPLSQSLLLQVFFEAPAGNTASERTAPRLYVLVDPMIGGKGDDDRGSVIGSAFAGAETTAFLVAADPPLLDATVGLQGIDDGVAQLRTHHALLSPRLEAGPGNIAFAGRVPLERGSGTFTIYAGFGHNLDEARMAIAASRSRGVDQVERDFVSGWRGWCQTITPPPETTDTLYWASVLILAACEDKENPGAFIASPTMPWGDIGGPWGDRRGDTSDQYYFKVWSRDLYHTTTALLAAGDPAPALRALAFLDDRLQSPDGSFPQTADVTGRMVWPTVQMDQVAVPILLAHRLLSLGLITAESRWLSLVKPAADYLADHGPSTRNERWENVGGYSPATIAAEIAGLYAAFDIARRAGDMTSAFRYHQIARTWDRSIENWTFTVKPSRFDGGGHFVKINLTGTPNETDFNRDDLDVSFLELVRLGVRRADDPLVLRTLVICDRRLRRELPTGAGWLRYNDDGYGENGQGRIWPLLSGERGHYEIAAGRSAAPHIQFLRRSANGVILPEQVWDVGPSAGLPTGSAAPLAWAHAEYLKLVLSEAAGRVVDLPELLRERLAPSTPLASHVIPFVSEDASEMTLFRVYGELAVDTAAARNLSVTIDGVPSPFRVADGFLELLSPVTATESTVSIVAASSAAEPGRAYYDDRPLVPVAERRARRALQWVALAGSFNHWNPGDRDLELRPDTGGILLLKKWLEPGIHEYKFTVNGTWEINYGGREGVLQKNGPNFHVEVPEAGAYLFRVDITGGTQSVERLP